MLRPKTRPPFPTVWDNTMRSDIVSCPTRAYWAWLRKLTSQEPSIDLIAGGAFARGLEVFRLDYYGEKKSKEEALQHAMVEAIAAYGEVEVPSKKEHKGPDRVITALAAYFERFDPATDYIQPHFAPSGKPMVEFTFSIPLPITHPETGEPLIYAGRFDMVGMYRGQMIGVDEKTATQLGSSWQKQWNLRAQFTGYTWAMREYGFPVIGIMVRGVSFLSPNSKVAWNGTGHGFEESLQLRPDYMIDAWYEQLLRDLTNFKQAWLDGVYDQNFSESCASYAGCPFQTLCQSPDPEPFTSNYATRDWDPLAKVPEKRESTTTQETVVDPMLADFLKG